MKLTSNEQFFWITISTPYNLFIYITQPTFFELALNRIHKGLKQGLNSLTGLYYEHVKPDNMNNCPRIAKLRF